MNQKLVRFLVENIFDGRGFVRIAEIGCGSGYASHIFARQSGVTLSVAMDINTQLFSQSGIKDFGAAFVVGDVFHLPFRHESFDLVHCSSSLEHFDTPQEALSNMAEVTKPGGLVFVGVPYLFGLMALYYLTPLKKWRFWLGRPFTFNELETMFAACDLKIQKRLVYFAGLFAGVLGIKPV
jgi:ubiquinone/menaquinone biosynthesis C-methylase UbiE